MLGPRVLRSSALVLSLLAGLACGDYSQSTSPSPAARKLGAPTTVSTSRYVLISGVWTEVPDDDGSKGEESAELTGSQAIGGALIPHDSTEIQR